MKEGKFYVYAHINKSNGKIYIGKTSNPNRRWYVSNYTGCEYFYRAIKKYGWKGFNHIILAQCSLEEDAFKFERELISHYNSTDSTKGYNIALGGLGGNCGKPAWNKGTQGLMPTPWNKGKTHSEETRQKISNSKKGHKYGSQSELHKLHKAQKHKEPVLQYSLNGKLIKVWPSAVDIQEELKIDRKAISSAIHHKSMAKGYLWFKEKNFTDDMLVEAMHKLSTSLAHYSKDLLAELNNMYKVKPGLFIDRPNSITHYLNTQM